MEKMRPQNILKNNSATFSKPNKTLSHSFKIAINFKQGEHKESQTVTKRKERKKEPAKGNEEKGEKIHFLKEDSE